LPLSDEPDRDMPIAAEELGPALTPDAADAPLEADGEGDLDLESLDFVRERFWESACTGMGWWVWSVQE
jgi:hypothetical protein